MLTREYVGLSRQQELRTNGASLSSVDSDETALQLDNILFDRLRSARDLVHLSLQIINVSRVAFQRVRNLFFKVINDHEIREEGQNIFDFEYVSVF